MTHSCPPRRSSDLGILEANAAEIARLAGPGVVLIEPGAGATRKVRILLDVLDTPAAFMPVDISGEHLVAAARQLAADYPLFPILPVIAEDRKRTRLNSSH